MQSDEDKLFCDTAVRRKLVTRAYADECLSIVGKMAELGINESVSHVMVKKGYLSQTQSKAVYKVMGLKRGEEIIPGYEIVAKLGEGGMGAVYKARKVGSKLMVALKVLPPRLAKDKKQVQRFMREAAALATLKHENIVAGYEVGEARQLYYFVMEFVDGPTLQEVLDKRGKLTEKESLRLVIQVAKALDHASSHGVVHRDIKPENIMIADGDVAKLSDLGLSKNMDETRITVSGTIFGTPNYISPEQARGQDEIDPRSDIYSLGATFYHMLTGSVPFTGDSPLVVLNRHATEAIPSPKLRNPDLSDGVCRIIKRMTESKREMRYQSVRELLVDLEKHAAQLNKSYRKPENFIIIARNQLRKLRKRNVNDEQRDALKKRAASLNIGGVFVESNEVLDFGELVELGFVLPDGKKEGEALGIVEWRGKENGKSGFGIRLVKLDTNEKAEEIKPDNKQWKYATSFDTLLLKKINQKLLKLYFRELDHECDLSVVTRKCGASMSLVEESLGEFEYLGLLTQVKSRNAVKFIRPDDKVLWGQIADWVRKHGLS